MTIKTLTYEHHDYQIDIEKITPTLAAKYLETIKLERRLTNTHVKMLARRLKDEHWEHLNGDAICFDSKGHLVDGQHRLQAVVTSGCSIVTFTIRGVQPDIYYGKDKGRKRCLSDTLSMLGYENTNSLASTLQWLFLYKENRLGWQEPNRDLLDDRFAVALLKEHSTLPIIVAEAVRIYRQQKAHVFNATGMVGFYVYLFSHIDESLCNEFFRKLIALETSEGTPVYYLQMRLMRSVNAKPRKDKMSMLEQRSAIQKTWNLFVQGQRIDSLRGISWKYNEDFPPILNQEGKPLFYDDIKWQK